MSQNLSRGSDTLPESLAARAQKAVQRLRPHLGVRGINVEFQGVNDGVVRIRVFASGPQGRRHMTRELRREIEDAVLEMAPDADDLVIDGLEAAGDPHEVYVPFTPINRSLATKSRAEHR